jgi:hypothetical protein
MGDRQEQHNIYSDYDKAIFEYNSYKQSTNTLTCEVYKMEEENGKFYVVEIVASYS